MATLNGHLNAHRILSGDLYGGIATGTFNYNELENKPSINGTTLQGDITLSIPTKTSDLTNDSGFITSSDIPTIPTKTSDLTNDSGFITSSDVPTLTSELINDSGYITENDIPTNVSAFTNDAGYVTSATAPVKSVNGLSGDVTIFVPSDTSQLNNDSGFITANDIPVTSVNTLTGDVVLDGTNVNYDSNTTINSKIDSVEGSIPTNTSDLNNDSGFITSSDIPVTSVNTKTGDVVLDGSDIEYSSGVTINSKIDSVENSIPTDTTTIENVSIASFDDGEYDKALNELIINIDVNVNGYTEANIVNTPDNIAPLWSIDNAFRGVVNFNQLSPVYDISVAGGTAFITGTTIVSDHKYFVSRKLGTNSNVTVGIFTKVNGTTTQCFSISGTMTATIVNSLNGGVSLGTTAQTDGNIWLYQNAAIRVYDLQIIDLTDMFGATIADYIYSLEQDNAGEGIAFFKSIYPNDYYVYDSGTNELVGSREGTTYNIPFGQSVTSGGELNVTTGELDITGGSTVTLTPTDVNTIIGYNNIYSDCGNVKKLTYYKLTALGVYNWVKTQI